MDNTSAWSLENWDGHDLVTLCGYKSKLDKVYSIEALCFDFCESFRKRIIRMRRQMNFVSIHMHEPICIERSGELFFAFKDGSPTKYTQTRDSLYTNQSMTPIAFGNRNRPVRGLIVANVYFNALSKEILRQALIRCSWL